MNFLNTPAQRTLSALALALLAQSLAFSGEREEAEAVQLQRNLHEMRAVMERERAVQDGNARANTLPLRVDSLDSPGIGIMREQLAKSLERLENRCFGIDMNVKDGNAILICGNNTGVAENSSNKNLTNNTIVIPPAKQPVKASDTGATEGP